MNKKLTYLYITIIVLVIAIVAILFFRGNKDLQLSISINEKNSVALPTISPPAGWYSWGGASSNPSSTSINSITIADQPVNNTGNNTSTLIVITARAITDANGMPTSTDAEWSQLRYTLDNADSQTSTQLWGIVDNKLVLEEEGTTPAGRYTLSYYLIYGGDEYLFQLVPSPFFPSSSQYSQQYNQANILNSPGAQVLRELVNEIAEKI